MSTTAATWFYHAAEKSPYILAERVRNTYWEQRLGGIWLDAVQTEGIIKMEGQYEGTQIKMEWETAKWLRLFTNPNTPMLAKVTQSILMHKPTFRYDAPEGDSVWEWWFDDAGLNKRWQEVQGKPAYSGLERLDGK